MGEALPKLAFPIMPTICQHFTKKNGKRGKPSPASVCAVCGRMWTQHHPRGPAQPVKHPECVLAHQITLSAKGDERAAVAEMRRQPVLTKIGVDKPKPISAVEEVIEEPKKPKPKPKKPKSVVIEEPKKPKKPKPVVIEEPKLEPKPEVEAIIEPPAEAFEEPEEEPSSTPSGRSGLMAFFEEQEQEERSKRLADYMAKGMSREEAQAKVDDDYDW